ncbi:EpsG family protein [Ralstonia mannitolilytica]|uniref:EpsG family protein n=2 Tax=Ralstonia mannitolilytica TaxID=105219 RepID=UPI0023E3D694|nr:EpsG family protein [Ralstonia mannitolilytica]
MISSSHVRRGWLTPSSILNVLLLCGVLIPAAALRLGLATADTEIYLQEYTKYTFADGLMSGPFEPAFMLLSWLAKRLDLDAASYLWIVASIGVFLKIIGICRSSQFIALSILVYISKYFLLHEMIQVRAGIATGIFLCSLPFLHQRRWARYLICVLIATAFHQSAIIYIVLYPICGAANRKLSSVIPLVASGLLFAALNMNGALINFFASYVPKVENYLELLAAGEHAEIHLFNVEVILKVVIWFTLAARYERLCKEYFIFEPIFKIWTLSIVSYFALSSVPVFAFRISELLDVVAIPLLPALIVACRNILIGRAMFFAVIALSFVNYYFIQPIFL